MYKTFLEQALKENHLSSDVEKLNAFLELMAKWNKVYNLTAITNPKEMVYLHILDSLSIVPYLIGERILDIGSGGGLPGIPLAIQLPHKQFTLLDKNSKKTRFLIQVIAELGLKNVEVVHSRCENYEPRLETCRGKPQLGTRRGKPQLGTRRGKPQLEACRGVPQYGVDSDIGKPGLDATRDKYLSCFDSIISRAFGSIELFIKSTEHLLCNDGVWIAMKGKYPQDEIEQIQSNYQVKLVKQLKIVGVDILRHIVCVAKKEGE